MESPGFACAISQIQALDVFENGAYAGHAVE